MIESTRTMSAKVVVDRFISDFFTFFLRFCTIKVYTTRFYVYGLSYGEGTRSNLPFKTFRCIGAKFYQFNLNSTLSTRVFPQFK